MLALNATHSTSFFPYSQHSILEFSDHFGARQYHYSSFDTLNPTAPILNIQSWAVDVLDAVSLPPLANIPRSPDLPPLERQSHQKNRFFQISRPIPRYVSNEIRSQMANSIAASGQPVTLLQKLPHPVALPLVSSRSPSMSALLHFY